MNTRTTILIVDDVEANRQTLVELLGADNYQLVEAGDGSEALTLAGRGRGDPFAGFARHGT